MVGWMTTAASLAALPALLAVSWPFLSPNMGDVQRTVRDLFFAPSSLEPYVCVDHNYTTQIVSVDPLVIYIHNFLSDADVAALLHTAEDSFKPSFITKNGRKTQNPDRTSHSAFLPFEEVAVRCVADRAMRFSGALLKPGRDEVGMPQLVRYTEGQRFNQHWDWYESPQKVKGEDGKTRRWNRVASFFAILEDDCEEGETWFPQLTPVTDGGDNGLWRNHPDGGIVFKPIKGNSLFWVNLQANGKGDKRVKHAGLPVKGGRKTAMNIWPRRYFD